MNVEGLDILFGFVFGDWEIIVVIVIEEIVGVV